jgi:hypothetical protein
MVGFWVVVIASVLLVFLWGLLSPRSQWKVLVAWSYRNPEADEPSAIAFGIQRVISGIGILFFLALGALTLSQYLASLPPPAPPLNPIQQMWGVAPVPQVVNRVVNPSDSVPETLVEVTIEGYQPVDNANHRPRYLYLLEPFNPGGNVDQVGIVGVQPAKDFPALDSAELVVGVRTWAECIPKRAVVIETETTVQVAIYVGMPTRSDKLPVDHSTCDRPALVQNLLMVPINLSAELGDREVQALDGTPIENIEVVTG